MDRSSCQDPHLSCFSTHIICRDLQTPTCLLSGSRDDSQPTYSYERLPSDDYIRILELLPGSSGPLECRLELISLREATNKNLEYEAVSYVWGDASQRMRIICDGSGISVTANLYEALNQLRLPDKSRRLWADCICIDQANLQERASQVVHMKEIFTRACKVIAWVGPADPWDIAALEFIEGMGEECLKRIGITIEELASIGSLDELVLGLSDHHDVFPSSDNPLWGFFFRFFELPYLARTWIVQELQFNANIHARCGPVEINFVHIAIAATWIKYAEGDIFDRMITDRGIGNVIHIRGLTRLEHSLLGRLHGTRGFFASDPRDKIFAFAGNSIRVDYTKSILDVFLDVVQTLLAESGYDCLSYVVHPKTLDHGFPTWIPKFDYSFISPLISLAEHRAGGSRDSAEWEVKGARLRVRALRIDTIVTIEEVMAWSELDISRWSSLAYIDIFWRYTDGELADAPYISGGTLRTAFAATLTCSGAECSDTESRHGQQGFEEYVQRFAEVPLGSRWKSPHEKDYSLAQDVDDPKEESSNISFSEFLPTREDVALHGTNDVDYDALSDESSACYSTFMSFPCGPEHEHDDAEYINEFSPRGENLWSNEAWLRRHQGEKWPLYQRAAQSACNNRRIFRTSEGYIGLGPKRMRAQILCEENLEESAAAQGDQVWILMGAKTPFVLRPSGDGFRLVGECYVHGVMYGEALKGLETDKYTQEWIELY